MDDLGINHPRSLSGTQCLPAHGTITCRKCFDTAGSIATPHPMWRLRNDPGAWGSSEPKVLVLGFSKGETQADIYARGTFDDVAFGGKITRRYLTRILQKVDLLRPDEKVDEKMVASEHDFAFGSLVRCSSARVDEKELRKTGKKAYKTSGELILKSFSEISEIVRNCTERFLADLPSSVKLICFLGVTDQYIKKCRNLMDKMYSDGFTQINEVAYATERFVCVHLTHPSKGNGTKEAWLETDPNDPDAPSRKVASAKKRKLAQAVIQPLMRQTW